MAIEEILANGLTSFTDAGSSREAISLYREFLNQEKLKVRLWVMMDGRDQSMLAEWFAKGPEVGTGNNFLTIRAIKLFADGALGSRGAWLLKPYADRPRHSGHATISMDTVYKTSQKDDDRKPQQVADVRPRNTDQKKPKIFVPPRAPDDPTWQQLPQGCPKPQSMCDPRYVHSTG